MLEEVQYDDSDAKDVQKFVSINIIAKKNNIAKPALALLDSTKWAIGRRCREYGILHRHDLRDLTSSEPTRPTAGH